MIDGEVLPPSDERSKADQEKWKALQKAIPLTENAGNFIYKVVGPFAEALGGILGDQMKAWRASNLDRLSQIWENTRKERKVDESVIQALPFGDAYRTIDSASKEDDPDVQELWAQIICNATDARSDVEMKRLYVDLLDRINGIEAKILKVLFAEDDYFTNSNEIIKPSKDTYGEEFDEYTSENIRLSLENLHRLRIITPSLTEYEIFNTSTHEEWIKSINEKNFVAKFASAMSNIVAELTSFSGSPMNDVMVPDDRILDLILSYGLTRIGYDLHYACLGKIDGK